MTAFMLLANCPVCDLGIYTNKEWYSEPEGSKVECHQTVGCPGLVVKSASAFDAGKLNDPVNNPAHYTSDPSGVECIQITRHRNFNIGNAIKYLWRAGLKDGNSNTQDLRKAVWYLQDEIKRIEGEG